MALDQYYQSVSGDESADPLVGEKQSATRPPPAPRKKRSLLTTIGLGALLLALFIAAVAVVSSVVVSYRTPSTTTEVTSPANITSAEAVQDTIADKTEMKTIYDHTLEERNCGGTPDEARAAGCVFDVMMQLWTPPECLDTPLSERYLEQGNWTWWADTRASRTLSLDEMRKGEHEVIYVDQSYHRHHCIFAWERLVRALRNQGPLIEELISYDHVMHCRHKTLTPPEEGGHSVRGVIAPTGYTKCASYDVWINNLPFNKMSSTD